MVAPKAILIMPSNAHSLFNPAAVKLGILAMLAAGLIGCVAAIAEDVSPFEALQRLVGKNVSVAIDRLGEPQDEHLLGNVVEYSWGMAYIAVQADGVAGTEPKNPYSACKLALTADVRTHVIKRYTWKETCPRSRARATRQVCNRERRGFHGAANLRWRNPIRPMRTISEP
jgi:hypothetical protein